jgi:UDP-2,3-diacylglucosamine hydrolase
MKALFDDSSAAGQLNGPANRSDQPPVGLIAGWGNYPVEVVKALRRQGRRVAAVGLIDHADPLLAQLADHFCWRRVAQLGGQQRWLQQYGVREVVLAGKLFKDRLILGPGSLRRLMPDWECIRTLAPHFLGRRRNTRDDTLLTAISNSFDRHAMHVVPGTRLAPQLLMQAGCYSRQRPDSQLWNDIRYGWQVAKQMGGLDIGQAVTIRNGCVLAVEAIEGTDACIERTSQLCPAGGWVLVKVAKPQQDERFDLPTVGLRTIDLVHRAGGRAIATEANQTIFLDPVACRHAIDQHRLILVALEPNDSHIDGVSVSRSSSLRAA